MCGLGLLRFIVLAGWTEDLQLGFVPLDDLLHRLEQIVLHVTRLAKEQETLLLAFLIELYLLLCDALQDVDLWGVRLFCVSPIKRGYFVSFRQRLVAHGLA